LILCVTLNPAVDRTLVVRGFANGGVFRPEEAHVAAGGKGINVARAIEILGEKALCAGFLGGFTGQALAKMLEESGIEAAWTWVEKAETRTCAILLDPDTLLTSVINEAGPNLKADDWDLLRRDLLLAAEKFSLVAFAGSLPRGLPYEGFAVLVAELIQAGKQVWVDCSGAALGAVWRVKGLALKINDEEAAALLKRPISSVNDALEAAIAIYQHTEASVIITLGKQGAVLYNQGAAYHAIPPDVIIKSGVGSGDSFLAGLLVALSRKASYEDCLGQATAAGTANALSIGGGSFRLQEFEEILKQVQVRPI
jgi:1-phosphofructokinase family hexose kinase